jgi:hypothetical protein
MLTLAFGGSMTLRTSTASASAQISFQYCYGSACLNAWNGGPTVKIYSPGVANNYFYIYLYLNYGNGNEAYSLEATIIGGAYNGYCIGDDGNSPGNASVGLVPCWNAIGGTGGWGINFKIDNADCPLGEMAFYNIHWRGYIDPPNSYSNGTEWYLNKPIPYCFSTVAAG